MQLSIFANPRAAAENARSLLASDPAQAVQQLRRLLATRSRDPVMLRLLGAGLRRLGADEEAEEAEQEAIANLARQPLHRFAAELHAKGEHDRLRGLLRAHLRKNKDDVLALATLGRVCMAAGDWAASERLLSKAVALAPSYSQARLLLVDHFLNAKQPTRAIAELDQLSAKTARSIEARAHRAAALNLLGRLEEQVAILLDLIRENPRRPRFHLLLGHALRTLGQTDEAIAAYRKVLELSPGEGAAWWSLANLKTVRFDDQDIAVMDQSVAADGKVENRVNLSFALGKAYEDRQQAETAFRHYEEGNRLRASLLAYDPAKIHSWVECCEGLFTASFFADREGFGCQSRDPIFVIGMQRSGSTLVEQILASHPAIEGTAELTEFPNIARELEATAARRGLTFGQHLVRLSAREVRELGQSYVEQTRVYRAESKSFFTDKMPNNWRYVGLIRLVLPNAKIIDVRRHPLACGFSNWKQLYAKGLNHSYSLETMGLFYADYVRLMRHMDSVQPGAVHRVIYERLVDDFENQVRRLLGYLGMPFDQACLAFHSSDRAVRTISAGQVRQPINRKGLDQWRPFEAWLDPLRKGLGPTVEDWET